MAITTMLLRQNPVRFSWKLCECPAGMTFLPLKLVYVYSEHYRLRPAHEILFKSETTVAQLVPISLFSLSEEIFEELPPRRSMDRLK